MKRKFQNWSLIRISNVSTSRRRQSAQMSLASRNEWQRGSGSIVSDAVARGSRLKSKSFVRWYTIYVCSIWTCYIFARSTTSTRVQYNEYHGDLLAIGCRGLLTRLRGLGVFVFPWRSAIICGLPRAAATDRLFGRLDASCASMIREPGWSIDRLYLLWWRREEREAVAWEINLMILLWWLTLTRTVSAHSRRASSLNPANYAFLIEDAA